MNTLDLAKLKQHLLQEIGEKSDNVYSWKTRMNKEDERSYIFDATSTNPPTPYIVHCKEIDTDYMEESLSPADRKAALSPGIVLDISFGVDLDPSRKADASGDTDDEDANEPVFSTNRETNAGDLYKVMNTVADIIAHDIENHKYIQWITFDPTKRNSSNPKSKKRRDAGISNARDLLYSKYIMKRIPNAVDASYINPRFSGLWRVRTGNSK